MLWCSALDSRIRTPRPFQTSLPPLPFPFLAHRERALARHRTIASSASEVRVGARLDRAPAHPLMKTTAPVTGHRSPVDLLWRLGGAGHGRQRLLHVGDPLQQRLAGAHPVERRQVPEGRLGEVLEPVRRGLQVGQVQLDRGPVLAQQRPALLVAEPAGEEELDQELAAHPRWLEVGRRQPFVEGGPALLGQPVDPLVGDAVLGHRGARNVAAVLQLPQLPVDQAAVHRPEVGERRYDHAGDNRGAVSFGLRTTRGIITGAALIMVAVFGGFATGRPVMLQEMGFGLAVAILIDATLVRSVRVPAALRLLGTRNWYLPTWLHWLPELRMEATHPTPTPTPEPELEPVS